MLPEFLLQKLQEQYKEELTKKIIEGYAKKRFVTLRVNTLKTDRRQIEEKLRQIKIEFETISFYQDAFIIKNVTEKQIEELDMYQNGEIYLQSLSSMLPPLILEPKQNTDILDMAAAPGGKTTQIAALTGNKAHITACEMKGIRAERLKYNLQKQGATSVYVMVTDARRIDSFFSFDQILLDAPCSGSGTIQIDKMNLKESFSPKLIEKCMNSQSALLEKAVSLLKPGKEMVYSTCSILACENEEILEKVLKKRQIEIIPIQTDDFQELPLLPTQLPGTICVCPNELFEGFFIAKIRKKIKNQ